MKEFIYSTLLPGLIHSIVVIGPTMIAIAYLTLWERKTLGYCQLRKGPNVVGWYGSLQPLGDGVKLFTKELIVPSHSHIAIYIGAPILALTLSLLVWFLLPWMGYENGYLFISKYSLLIILAINSITVFSIYLSGWSSNSKYASMGGLRAVAQMVSFEVSITIVICTVALVCGSWNIITIYNYQNYTGWLLFPLLPSAIMFLISCFAETNRAPFDLSEGESELVSGYNVEYSGMPFALFFLAEYGHIIFSSFLFVILFMGGNNFTNFTFIWKEGFMLISIIWTAIKVSGITFLFLWARATLPRIRYDQLMSIMWKNFLPFSVAFLWLVNGLIILVTTF